MVTYIAIIFNEICFKYEFKNSKRLIARYENVHKLLDIMPEFVWILKALWGPNFYVMLLTPSEVETCLDYPNNTIVFIKKKPRIYRLNKLLASTKAQT